MTRNFHRWEVDPFFTAAEEVQDSADRLELAYRTWVHAKSADVGANESVGLEHHRRELSTSLGTAKWQLEEFERAVFSSDTDVQGGTPDDTPARHKQFVYALQNRISLIERSLLNSGDSRDLKALPVMQLGQKEKDDLALFLCGSKAKSHEELKKTVFCTSSTLSDGKNDEEITSESVKSSNEVSECFSNSASNSENSSSNANSRRSVFFYRPQELGFVNRSAKDASSLEVCIVQDKKPFVEPASEHLHIRGGEISPRAGDRSGSSGSGLSTRKIGAATGDRLINNASRASKIWPPFLKKLGVFDRRLSRSGLKRWKDGDLNSMDHPVVHKLMREASDLERGNEGSNTGGTSNCSNAHVPGCISGNSLHSKRWSESPKMLQSFMYAFSGSQSVHKASAVVVSGFAGLIIFRIILSAL